MTKDRKVASLVAQLDYLLALRTTLSPQRDGAAIALALESWPAQLWTSLAQRAGQWPPTAERRRLIIDEYRMRARMAGRQLLPTRVVDLGALLDPPKPPAYKTCGCCREEYSREQWGGLECIGIQELDGERLELRNCPCGSTMAVELPSAAERRCSICHGRDCSLASCGEEAGIRGLPRYEVRDTAPCPPPDHCAEQAGAYGG